MLRYNDYSNYTIADRRFYDEYGRADLPYELEHLVRDAASADDEIVVNNYWVICRPAALPALADHGWKIHVSVTPTEALRALEIVTAEFRREPFHFKCLRDLRMVTTATSRGWPTGQVGKVIAIYPRDAEETRALLGRLHQLLAGISGPYVLTDRRYRDSTCLYYRYGQHAGSQRLRPDGTRSTVLIGPNGEEWDDSREPAYRTPPWVGPLFDDEQEPEAASRVINGYRFVGALSHGGAGGVYLAERESDGARVVIKESRPHTAFALDGSDRHTRLRREFEALTLLADAGVAPRPYELFEAWEHLFLAQEFVEGVPLTRFIAATRPQSYTEADEPALAVYREQIDAVVAGVRAAIDACHERGVGFGDLSLNNVFVDPETLQVTLIDFESCQPLSAFGGDLPMTPGFVPPPNSAAWRDGRAFDLMGVASVELAMISNRNLLRAIDDGALARTTAWSAALLRRPLGDLFERLELEDTTTELPTDLDLVIKESMRFVESVMDTERGARVFPADPLVFGTNPWSVGYGVAGVARALHRLTGSLPPALDEWIARAEGLDRLPAGL
ncbi:MAG: hypothetical protein QOD39_2438, partial [Mycobacterium sp.]|nr:hypothetical protein [Mycobacterium sp.]